MATLKKLFNWLEKFMTQHQGGLYFDFLCSIIPREKLVKNSILAQTTPLDILKS